jgi:hypothetical protein
MCYYSQGSNYTFSESIFDNLGIKFFLKMQKLDQTLNKHNAGKLYVLTAFFHYASLSVSLFHNGKMFIISLCLQTGTLKYFSVVPGHLCPASLNPFQWDFLFVEPIANNTHADGSWV